jgi:hypothetical protein
LVPKPAFHRLLAAGQLPQARGLTADAPVSDCDPRQRLRELITAAKAKAGGDQQRAPRLFVDALAELGDAALLWELLGCGRDNAIRRLFMEAAPNPASPRKK